MNKQLRIGPNLVLRREGSRLCLYVVLEPPPATFTPDRDEPQPQPPGVAEEPTP